MNIIQVLIIIQLYNLFYFFLSFPYQIEIFHVAYYQQEYAKLLKSIINDKKSSSNLFSLTSLLEVGVLRNSTMQATVPSLRLFMERLLLRQHLPNLTQFKARQFPVRTMLSNQ